MINRCIAELIAAVTTKAIKMSTIPHPREFLTVVTNLWIQELIAVATTKAIKSSVT